MIDRSIVLISYVFPPDSAVGAVRVGKFATGLANDHGWSLQVVVPRTSLAAGPASSVAGGIQVRPTRETDILGRVAATRRIWKRSRNEACSSPGTAQSDQMPGASARRRSPLARLTDLAAVPDNRSGWIYWAFREAVRSVKRAGENAVILSSGPPHSAHVAAAMAKRRTGCPWVADMRDPWTENPYNLDLAPLAARCNRALERCVLRAADAILCTTEPARQNLLMKWPAFSEDTVITVPNGFDPEDFAGIRPKTCWPDDDRLVLLHAGSVYGKRSPVAFLQALAALHTEQPAKCPRVVFLGNWDAESRPATQAAIEAGAISHLVSILDAVPRRQALAIQAAADWLVLLGDADAQMLQIPGKLFEYLALEKPILSLFGETSPVQPYLEGYARSFVAAAPDDPPAILAALRQIALRPEMRERSARPLAELHRCHQVACVNEVLESCLELRDSPARRGRVAETASVVSNFNGMKEPV